MMNATFYNQIFGCLYHKELLIAKFLAGLAVLWEIGHFDRPQTIKHKRVHVQHFLMLQKANEKEPHASR